MCRRRRRRRLDEEFGYSLVEVMVSILLLSIAVIPMVAMLDAGLRAASTSGNYDKARTFANERLENAKSLPYATVDTDTYPTGSTSSSCGGGCRRYDGISVPASVGLSTGATYRVEKLYLDQPATSPGGSSVSIEPSSSDGTANDEGLMKITVTVSWGAGNSYTTSGVVAG